jgi:hypothetical protein
MKIAQGIYALAVVALLAGGSVASANTSSGDNRDVMKDPSTDNTGVMALGFDISFAGDTPDTIRPYMARLTPHQQYDLINGCRDMTDHPLYANPHVLSFCTALVGMSQGVPLVATPPMWGHHFMR